MRQGRHARRSATSTARSPRRSHGRDALDQAGLDRALIDLDGTPNKARLGANAILGVSLAAARAAAAEERLPLWRYLGGEAAHVLPVPMMNVLNGGAHADNSVDFQEFMVVPVGAPTLRRGAAHGRRGLPRAQEARCTTAGSAAAVGDEGGFAPNLESNEAALQALDRGHRGGGLHARRGRRDRARPGDVSEIFEDGAYVLEHEGRTLSPTSWPATGPTSPRRYPIVSIEDGMDEEDWDGWKALTDRLGDARPARRRRPVRDQHRAPASAASTPAWPTRS